MFRFRVGPFPIKVFPSFLIIALVFGMRWANQPWLLAAWVFICFVSVVVHELGHALVGRALGGSPEIHLEGLGGVTFPNLPTRPGALRSIALSFAGPFFGLLLGGAAWLLERAWPPQPTSLSEWVVEMFQLTSVIWAIFNLLPILPLDGGNIMLAALEGIRKKPSAALASWISAAIAAAAALITFLYGYTLMPIWCLLYAVQNGMRAHAMRGQAALPGQGAAPKVVPPPAGSDPFEQADVKAATDRVREALKEKDPEAAQVFAEQLEHKGGPFRQAAGLRLRAGIELSRGDNEAAALYAGQSFSISPSVDAAIVAARANLRGGQIDRARNWLRRAVEAGAPAAAVRDDPELSALA